MRKLSRSKVVGFFPFRFLSFFLVVPVAHQQSDLSSHCCVYLYLFVLWTDYFLQEINTRWLGSDLKDTPQEMLKDTLET